MTESTQQQWTEISNEDGIIASVMLDGERVTGVQMKFSEGSRFEPDDSVAQDLAYLRLKQWNTNPKRDLVIDEESWTRRAEGTTDIYETKVQTTFVELISLYLEMDKPLHREAEPGLLRTIVRTLSDHTQSVGLHPLSDMEEDRSVLVLMIGASFQRVGDSPFTEATRPLPAGDELVQPFELRSLYCELPLFRAPIPLEDVDDILSTFEELLLDPGVPEFPERDLRNQRFEMLRRAYLAIAKSQGTTLAEVNKQRGNRLPTEYLN